MMTKSPRLWLTLVLLVVLMPGLSWAQSLNATISGSVTDQTGAVVPGAEATLTAIATGAVAKVTTGPDGLYSFPNLQQGGYELQVTAKGFETFVQKGILVHLNESVRVPVTLQLGTAVQTVEVTANASPLNYETPEVKGAIGRTEIAALPLQVSGGQRSAAVFVTLLPGVNPGGAGDAFTARFNGGQQFSDEATVDGVSMQEGLLSQSGMIGIHNDFPISPESVGEISVLTSNYDVQYGSSPAAVITASTKSGTNEFHGGAYEYHRDTVLNARQFGVANRSKDLEQDFGGFVGGPLKFLPKFWTGRKKSYFFVNFEGYRSVGATTKPILTVPTVKMRTGDFSEWPNPIYDPDTTAPNAAYNPNLPTGPNNEPFLRQQFMGCNGTTPNVICPSDPRLGASLAPQWLKLVPPPNLPGLTANWESPNGLASSLNANTDQWDIRGDQYIGERDHVTATYHYRGSLPFTQHAFPAVIDTNNTRIPNYSHLIRINYDHTFTPTLLNHVAAGYMDLWTAVYNSSDCCVNQVPSIPGVFNHVHEPTLSFSEYDSYGGNADFLTRRPTYILNDTLTWVRGTHTLHIGGEYRNVAYPTQQEPNASGSFSFNDLNTGLLGITSGNSMASFLLGDVASANATFYSLAAFRPKGDVFGMFIGDTWKKSPKLSLTMGIRWDVFRPSVEAKDRTSFFDPIGPNPGAGNRPGRLAFAGSKWGAASFGRRHPEETFYRGFGPRVGLAYSLTPKTVIRSGYGVFFEQNFYPGWGGGIATDGFNSTASFSSSQGGLQPAFLLQNGFPQNFARPPFIDSSFLNGQNAPNYRPFDADHLPRAQQWNLTVEHQFTENFYISTAYVGNHGTRLTSRLIPVNALDPKYLSMGSKLYDQFQPGQTTLDGIPIPYAGWVQQMTGCPPTVAQALVPFPQYCDNIYGSNENVGASTYNSLQVKVEKRYARGLWLLTSYTLSKNLTNADSAQSASTTWSGLSGVISPFERKRNKALADDDLPQILTVSLVYDLPFGTGKRFLSGGGILNKLVEGWQATSIVRAESGQPFFFRSGFCNVPSQFAVGCIPALVPGAKPFLQSTGSFDPGKGPLFNVAAFEPPSSFNFYYGKGPRVSDLRGFGFHNHDFGLSKETRITERVAIQIRFEAFNLWNWHIFTQPSNFAGSLVVNNDVSSPNFGLWNGGVTAPRNIQLGAKIIF